MKLVKDSLSGLGSVRTDLTKFPAAGYKKYGGDNHWQSRVTLSQV